MNDKSVKKNKLDQALMQKAIDGDMEAQITLAALFELGLDRDEDLEQAKKWSISLITIMLH